MSLAEIKEQIAELSPEERLEVAALIAHLNRAQDPVHQEELGRRLDRMARGQQFTAAEVEKLHRELSAQGN
ncbi:MAG: hypothetical protein HY646_02025 [Acidobacteria bacterium]|nr:hypothetical protein [Acidobacteriota bacterium]